MESYKLCGQYLLSKMPVGNVMLAHVASLDPSAATKLGKNKAMSYMLKLPSYVPTVISADERDAYDREVRNFQFNASLPPEREDKRADVWWGSVKDQYPVLSRY